MHLEYLREKLGSTGVLDRERERERERARESARASVRASERARERDNERASKRERDAPGVIEQVVEQPRRLVQDAFPSPR